MIVGTQKNITMHPAGFPEEHKIKK